MSDNNRNLAFSKWEDPLEDLSIQDSPPAKQRRDYDDGYESDDDDMLEGVIFKKVPVVATPMGIVPITEWTEPGKVFNFWIGHTNFNISKMIAKTIEETDGVEILDVFTRYTFRIAVGKIFKPARVMHDIGKRLGVRTKKKKKAQPDGEAENI